MTLSIKNEAVQTSLMKAQSEYEQEHWFDGRLHFEKVCVYLIPRKMGFTEKCGR